MPGPEGSGGAGNDAPPPKDPYIIQNRIRAEAVLNGYAARQEAKQVNGGSILDAIAASELRQTASATEPEDIYTQKKHLIWQINYSLVSAQIEPTKEESLFTKMGQIFPPEDARIITTELQSRILADLNSRKERQNQVRPHQIEWENRWADYFQENPDVIQQVEAYKQKDQARYDLVRNINKLKNGEDFEGNMEYTFRTGEFTPGDVLYTRFKRLAEAQGKKVELENIQEVFFAEIKKQIDANTSNPQQSPLDPWVQEWQGNPDFQGWLENNGASAANQAEPQSEDERYADELAQKRTLADAAIVEILEIKESMVPDPENVEAVRAVTFEQIIKTDASISDIPEKIYLDKEIYINDLVKNLIDARIGPDVTQDQLYKTLEMILSDEDYTEIVQKIRYQMLNTYQHGDPQRRDWEEQWADFFTKNPTIENEVHEQGRKNEFLTKIAQNLDNLAAHPDQYVRGAFVHNLQQAKFTPNEISTNPLVNRIFEFLANNGQDPQILMSDFYEKLAEEIQDQKGSLDPRLQEWANDDHFLAWQHNQSRPTTQPIPTPRPGPANPNTAPENLPAQRVSRFKGLADAAASWLKPQLVNTLDKVKKGVKEVGGSATDLLLGSLLGAGIRWGVTSVVGPGTVISMGVGFAEGSYKAFRRANSKYEADLRSKAATGDAAAKTELTDFENHMHKKENFFKKELMTKRKEAWKRFKKLPPNEKTKLASYTALGGILGATGGVLGFQNMDLFMGQEPAAIEQVIKAVGDPIKEYINRNFTTTKGYTR